MNDGDTIEWPLVLGTGAVALGLVGLFYLSIQGAGHAARIAQRNPVRKRSMAVQSLLFSRSAWSPSKAKAWARSHGYRSGKVDMTEKNIRLRQKSPSGKHTFRTVTFGRGIKAVVAR
jgi:hypothetical protein